MGFLGACGGDRGSIFENSQATTTMALRDTTTTTLAPVTTGSSVSSTTTMGEVDTSLATTTTTGTTETTTTTGTTEPPGGTDPTGGLSLDDTVLEELIAEGATDPFRGLPARDALATALLSNELESAGFDLTGMELVVYPAGQIPAFVFIGTNDETSLIEDDSGAESFITQLLTSAAITNSEVTRLVMQHTSADEDGPYVLTLTVLTSDLQEAVDTGLRVFDRMAVQVERA